MLGTLNFHWSVPGLAPPTLSSLSETVQVEVLRAASEEESTPGAPVQEKMTEVPAPIEAAGANISSHIDGGRTNDEEPRPEDVPS
jgi:hypothetical protein